MYGEMLFRRQKTWFWGEINAFSPLFYRKWILAMLVHEKCKFLFEISDKILPINSLLLA